MKLSLKLLTLVKQHGLLHNLIIATILILLPTLSYAQEIKQPDEYVLKIKPVDLNVMGKALGKLPFDEVSDLMQNLRVQVIEQQRKLNEPTKGPAKK